MHGETGLIQFDLRWEHAPAPRGAQLEELIACRNKLRALELIGVTPEGIGYGNVSHRVAPGSGFIVSGTNTGEKLVATADDFTEVTAYDLSGNCVTCRGPVRASAESLSHAAIYEAVPAVNAVIHVHHAQLWQRLYGIAPTTDPQALAGTKDLAVAIFELLQDDDAARKSASLVMGGHPEGVLAFGPTLESAATRLFQALGLESPGGSKLETSR